MSAPPIDLKQLAARESEQVEWKQNVADIDDVVATLCAFANDLPNLGGGYVVCGAQEVRDEHGFPRLVRTGLTASRLKEVENTVLARCRDRVAPPLTPLVTEMPAETGDGRILVFTQPATAAAHTCRRGRDGAKHFVRVGRATIEARNGVLLNLLVRKGAMEPWDRRPCAGATERDLDLLALRDVLNRMGVAVPDNRIEDFLSEDVALSPFVPALCVREGLTNVLRPRNFAILLFGRNVQRFIPGAFSLFSVYPGTDRSDRHAERHEIAGTVIEQARRLQGLLDGQVSTVFDKHDLAAPNADKYPRRALYEAMGNALAHRDYELADPIRVTAFADRIEVLSPGPLPLGVDPVAFTQGKAPPKWRNQALAWFFNRLLFAQAEGQGILTIFQTMQDEGCPPPIFVPSDFSVICTLPAHPRHVLMYDIQQAERTVSAGNVSAARTRIARILGKDPANIRGWQLFAELQHSVGDIQPLHDMVKLHPDAVIELPPPVLIEIAGALASGSGPTQSCRDVSIQLILAAGRKQISEHDLSRAAFILISLGAFPAVISLGEAMVAANPSWAADARLLSLRAATLLNAANRAGNLARDVALTPPERDSALRSFEELTARAVNLFTRALNAQADEQQHIGARRGLELIEFLKNQVATNSVQRGDRDT